MKELLDKIELLKDLIETEEDSELKDEYRLEYDELIKRHLIESSKKLKEDKKPYFELEMVLEDVGTCSTNQLTYGRGQYTTKARRVRDEYWNRLADYALRMKVFKKNFMALPPELQAISLEINYMWPKKHIFRATDGGLSRRAGDVDNSLKLLIDSLFNDKYSGRILKDGTKVQTLGIDDQYIWELVSRKLPHDKDQLDIQLKLICYK